LISKGEVGTSKVEVLISKGEVGTSKVEVLISKGEVGTSSHPDTSELNIKS
jgi:hypothetical protein